MDKDYRRPGDRRRPDPRDSRPRYDRNRSRSPPRHKDSRASDSDRRRERTPPRREGFRDEDRGRGSGPSSAAAASTSSLRDADARRDPARAQKPAARDAGPKAEKKDGEAMQQVGEDEDEESEMQRVMGFANFRSTKNTKVPGNEKNYAVSKVKKTEYRQYMNRVGGFNRPLSPSRA